jgi:hypothetical protein
MVGRFVSESMWISLRIGLLLFIALSPCAMADIPQSEPGTRLDCEASEPCGLLRFMDL